MKTNGNYKWLQIRREASQQSSEGNSFTLMINV